MQRITDPTAVATLPSPPALTGTTGYFGPAVPGISPATRVRYWFVTMLQEELMSILAAASITADTTGTVFNQVLLSIKALIAAVPHGVQTITTSGTFTVPTGVTTLDVEVWAGGSVLGIRSGIRWRRRIGRWLCAKAPVWPDAGRVDHGYDRGRRDGRDDGSGRAGGRWRQQLRGSGFTTISATGGVVSRLNRPLPVFGNHAGVGSGGDVNLYGGDGGNGGTGQGNSGVVGGVGVALAAMGLVWRVQRHGEWRRIAGYFPGGGACGAGTGSAARRHRTARPVRPACAS